MADFADGSWCPDISLEAGHKWRLKKAQFGDGYQQRALDGINALDQEWKVSWSVRPREMLLAMDEYLQAQLAKAFAFLDPGTGETFMVFCDEWTLGWQVARPDAPWEVAAFGQLSATFVKANGLTAGGGAP